MDRRKVVVDLQQIDLLEQKIVKATELIRSLRRERDRALSQVEEGRAALVALQEQAKTSEAGRRELQDAAEQLEALREERQTIRGRVSRMIEMMSALDEPAAEAGRDH